uniref:Uncharacterized protein n=1 Tax=Nelumbo nucifera TaxID=4432 RepID=A0A822YN57_NELNU|nr:TPA_asm: hypothetical protein HUJ06_012778 [Nelumbo nucifera]
MEKILRRKKSFNGKLSESPATTTSSSSTYNEEEIEWEMRPSGMLVQKRCEKSEVSAPSLRLRIAYGAFRYDISISSQATFGTITGSISFILFSFLEFFRFFLDLAVIF